jgi:hypothetical protein
MRSILNDKRIFLEHANRWPNPADTFITLKAPISSSQQRIEILNTTGQLVWTGELEPLQSEMVIAIDEIQSGLYHLLITVPQGSQSNTFYKK